MQADHNLMARFGLDGRGEAGRGSGLAWQGRRGGARHGSAVPSVCLVRSGSAGPAGLGLDGLSGPVWRGNGLASPGSARPARRCSARSAVLGSASSGAGKAAHLFGSVRHSGAGRAGSGSAQCWRCVVGLAGSGKCQTGSAQANAWRGLAGEVRRGGAWWGLGRVLAGSGLAGWVLHDRAQIVRRVLARPAVHCPGRHGWPRQSSMGMAGVARLARYGLHALGRARSGKAGLVLSGGCKLGKRSQGRQGVAQCGTVGSVGQGQAGR